MAKVQTATDKAKMGIQLMEDTSMPESLSKKKVPIAAMERDTARHEEARRT